MRSPHVPIVYDGSDDHAVRYEQLAWMMHNGYSRGECMRRRILLHDLAVKCAALFELLGSDPDLALRREKQIRARLEAL